MGYHDIVIIDDGVNERYLNSFRIKHDLEVGENLEIRKRIKEDAVFSHGTICAAVIARYAPGAVVGSVKVLDSRMKKGSSRQLSAVLKWCLGQEPMLIHLSIGTTQSNDFDEIKNIVSKLYRKGFLIIAAYDNQCCYTVPAALECVVGVRCLPLKLPDEGECGYPFPGQRCGKYGIGDTAGFETGVRIKEEGFEIFAEARGEHDLTLRGGRKYRTPSCNSFAAPYVTAMIHNRLPRDFTGGVSAVWGLLGREGKERLCVSPDFLDRAVVVDISRDEWPELFYFETESPGDGELLQDLKKNIYLVILADAVWPLEQLLGELVPKRAHVKGIFCCWKDDGMAERNCYGFGDCIWQEGYYTEKYCGEIEYGETEILVPVIYLYGERRKLTVVLQDLKKRFLEEGYQIKAAGQFQRAYLYGFEYIDSTGNRAGELYRIWKRFDCDIILCGIASREICHDVEDMGFWMWEECQDTGGNMLNVSGDGRIKKETDYAEMIYNKIVELF